MLIKTRFGVCYLDETCVVGVDRREYKDETLNKDVHTVNIIFGSMANITLEFLDDSDVKILIDGILKSKTEQIIPTLESVQQEENTYIDGFKDGCNYTLKLGK